MTFLYRCELKFEELPGTSDQHRRCDVCAKLVTNLDALSAKERRAFVERAATEERAVCVSMTQGVVTNACGGRERLDAIAANKLKSQGPPPMMGTVRPRDLPKR